VQVPVVDVAVALDPVDGRVADEVGRLVAHLGRHLHALAEVAEEVVGAVALGERGDRRAQVAGAAERLAEQRPIRLRRVAVVEPEAGVVAEVADDPVGDAVLAGDQRGARRQARRVRAVVAVEDDARGGHRVQVRRDRARVAVRAGVVRPQRVHVHVDELHIGVSQSVSASWCKRRESVCNL
jgi:hypothetical protein